MIEFGTHHDDDAYEILGDIVSDEFLVIRNGVIPMLKSRQLEFFLEGPRTRFHVQAVGKTRTLRVDWERLDPMIGWVRGSIHLHMTNEEKAILDSQLVPGRSGSHAIYCRWTIDGMNDELHRLELERRELRDDKTFQMLYGLDIAEIHAELSRRREGVSA